jgi:hypothetical protein
VVGSRATHIRFEDLSIRLAPPDAAGARQGVLSFVIDDNGVTRIVVEDQFDIQASAVEGNPAATPSWRSRWRGRRLRPTLCSCRRTG